MDCAAPNLQVEMTAISAIKLLVRVIILFLIGVYNR